MCQDLASPSCEASSCHLHPTPHLSRFLSSLASLLFVFIMAALPSKKALASLASLRSALQSIMHSPSLVHERHRPSLDIPHRPCTHQHRPTTSPHHPPPPRPPHLRPYRPRHPPHHRNRTRCMPMSSTLTARPSPCRPSRRGISLPYLTSPLLSTSSCPNFNPLPPTKKAYVPLSTHVFDAPARRDVIHSAVVYYLDAQRSGTASTKGRSDVSRLDEEVATTEGIRSGEVGNHVEPYSARRSRSAWA